MKSLIKIGQFAVRRPDQDLWTGVSCAVNLSPIEAERGHLLLLLNIPLAASDAEQMADALSDHLTTLYYTQTIPESPQPGQLPNLELLFEHLIKQTNAWLARTLKTYGRTWLERSDLFVGVIRGSELLFSMSGTVHPFLIQNKKVTDLMSATRSGGGYFNPFKPLASLITGQLEADARVAIITDGVLDYISPERLKKIILAQPAPEAAQALTSLLRIPKTKLGLAGIVLEPIWPQIALASEEKKRSALYTQQPIVAAVTTSTPAGQQPTRIILFVKQLGAILFVWLSRAGQHLRTFITAAYNFIRHHRWLTKKSHTARHHPAGANAWRGSMRTEKNATRVILSGLGRFIGRWSDRLWRRFRALPRSSQLLLVVSIFFALLFLQSIFQNGPSDEQQERSYGVLINTIESKTKAAEEALIYKDDNKAAAALKEAADLLSALPKNSVDRKKRAAQLQQAIDELANVANQVSAVTAPRLVSEVSQLDPPHSQYDLVSTGGTPLLFGIDQASIWNLASNQNPILVRRGGTNNIAVRQLVPLKTGQALIGGTGEIFHLQQNPARIELLTSKLTAVPLMTVSYEDRLYLLQPEKNTIYKTGLVPDQVAVQKSWIVDGSDMSKAVSLTIDGSIYVLFNNGSLLEFNRGSKTGWQAVVEPPLANPTKIWTQANSNFLYVLDPPSKRVVVLQKSTGKIKIQYTSQLFQNPSSFAVNEQTKELFILDGTKLFVVPMTHL